MADMQQAAVEHLMSQLNKMIEDSERVASSQEAAAEGTHSYKRRLGYEESAEFHRAFAAVVRQAIDAVQNNVPGAMPGFPGAAGTRRSDADGDRWIMCEDGHFRLLNHNGAVRPDEVAKLYGPMTLVGGA